MTRSYNLRNTCVNFASNIPQQMQRQSNPSIRI